MKNYRKILFQIIQENKWSIKEFVARDIFEQNDDYIIWYLKDLLSYGCQSWMARRMIRYTDTYKFFDTYYDEILEIIDELNSQWIEIYRYVQYDLKNWFAWLAYEETARDILLNDFGLDF